MVSKPPHLYSRGENGSDVLALLKLFEPDKRLA